MKIQYLQYGAEKLISLNLQKVSLFAGTMKSSVMFSYRMYITFFVHGIALPKSKIHISSL